MFLTGCGKNNEELVMVTEAGFAPYEYYSGDKIVGVDVDIAEEIAKELGKTLVIKDVAFDSIINEVKTGKADFGAAGISYSDERALQVDFTINYVVSRQVVIVKEDSNIYTTDDIYNAKIAVQLGSVADTYVTENYPSTNLVRQKKYLAAIEDLKDGKVDCVVMDELPAQEILKKNSGLKILPDALTNDSYGMIVKKGNTELLNAINGVLEKLVAEGKIDEYVINHISNSESNNYGSFIIEGLINTIVIAFFAVIIGIIIGILVSLIRNYHDETGKMRIGNFIAKLYVNIIRGTPVILQLMIIYYVIFKTIDINIILVGILAFGINSGAYVSEIIRAGINSIDKGQMEAGYSLGLGYREIMKSIIFPQAFKNILPALCNEFITLLKETSVGAYIGIIELTKASDIIASRTYDYFLPLIIIAIIYLVLTLGLSKLVGLLERKLNNVRN